MIERLLIKYRSGRRSAADLCAALAALRAQERLADMEYALLSALHALDPVPTTLWLWACDNLALLSAEAIRDMLALCADPRCARHLRNRADDLAATVDGVVALVRAGNRVPWALEVAARGVRAMMAAPRSDAAPAHPPPPQPALLAA